MTSGENLTPLLGMLRVVAALRGQDLFQVLLRPVAQGIDGVGSGAPSGVIEYFAVTARSG